MSCSTKKFPAQKICSTDDKIAKSKKSQTDSKIPYLFKSIKDIEGEILVI
jgi:hypothetical protein